MQVSIKMAYHLGCDAMHSGRKLTNVLEETAAFICRVAGSRQHIPQDDTLFLKINIYMKLRIMYRLVYLK